MNKCSYTFGLNGPASICRCCWDNKTYNITVLHTDFRQSLHTNVSSTCGARMHIYRQAGQLLTAQASFLTVRYEVFSVLLPFILAQMFSINFLSKIRADPAELGCRKVTGQKLGVVGWSAFWTVAPEIDETIDTKSCCAVALSVPSISCAAIQNAEYKKKVTEKNKGRSFLLSIQPKILATQNVHGVFLKGSKLCAWAPDIWLYYPRTFVSRCNYECTMSPSLLCHLCNSSVWSARTKSPNCLFHWT